MGGIWFDTAVLVDSLSETVGYKSGLALSLNAMYSHLADTQYADLLSLLPVKSSTKRRRFFRQPAFGSGSAGLGSLSCT